MSQAHHGSLLERVKTFIHRPFLFLNIEVSSHPGQKGSGVLLHEVWGASLGAPSLSLSPACWPRGFLCCTIRHCVVCRRRSRWLVDNAAAFSGAAKLRLLRGDVELAADQLVGGPKAVGTQSGRSGVAASRWPSRGGLRMESCLCFSCGRPSFSGCGWPAPPCWLPSSCVPGLSPGSARGPGGRLPQLSSCPAGV